VSVAIQEEINDKLSSTNQVIATNMSLSDRFRKELEGYLDDLDKKVTDDGEKLIKKPRNFDSIVNAMSRDDLFDDQTEETIGKEKQESNTKRSETIGPGKKQIGKPPKAMKTIEKQEYSTLKNQKETNKKSWYKYLLQDYINDNYNKEFDGRYSTLLVGTGEEDQQQQESKGGNSGGGGEKGEERKKKTFEERKKEEAIKKGLAEIFMLDRELFLISKKEGELSLQVDTSPRPGSTETGTTSELGTPYSMLGSRGSNQPDPTFLTKNRSSFAATTPKTGRESIASISASKKQQREKEGKERDNEEGIAATMEEESNSEEEEGGRGKVNRHPYPKLTEEQNKRIDELLLLDDDLEFEKKFAYFSKEEKEANKQLDSELEAYGRLSRLSEDLILPDSDERRTKERGNRRERDYGNTKDSNKKENRKENKKEKKDGNDYLREQRKERNFKDYEKNIDSMLYTITNNKEIDFRSFFSDQDKEEEKEGNGSPSLISRSSYAKSLVDVPYADEVK
jgi:hypothetical protein